MVLPIWSWSSAAATRLSCRELVWTGLAGRDGVTACNWPRDDARNLNTTHTFIPDQQPAPPTCHLPCILLATRLVYIEPHAPRKVESVFGYGYQGVFWCKPGGSWPTHPAAAVGCFY